jgi:hypothetical protein
MPTPAMAIRAGGEAVARAAHRLQASGTVTQLAAEVSRTPVNVVLELRP